ncbi:MAG: hypothetical protein U0176_02235 [Bacteroidia bacterium]
MVLVGDPRIRPVVHGLQAQSGTASKPTPDEPVGVDASACLWTAATSECLWCRTWWRPAPFKDSIARLDGGITLGIVWS